jgi:hypothetical protein
VRNPPKHPYLPEPVASSEPKPEPPLQQQRTAPLSAREWVLLHKRKRDRPPYSIM